MKNQILFAALAALTVYVSAAVLDPVAVAEPVAVVDSAAEVEIAAATSRNLNLGVISSGDRLLHRNYYIKTPIANAIQSQDIIYRGNSSSRVTVVQVNEVGYTQYATARIIAGAINSTTVTIRLSSARGYGYYFLVDIWGR